MKYYFRKIDKSNLWDKPNKQILPWLEDGDIPADPLTRDFKTDNNSISIYLIDNFDEHIDRVVSALASTRDQISKMDYITGSIEIIKNIGVVLDVIDGKTGDEFVNSLHRDMANLTTEKAALFVNAMIEKGHAGRAYKKDISSMILNEVEKGNINREKINRKIRTKLGI